MTWHPHLTPLVGGKGIKLHWGDARGRMLSMQEFFTGLATERQFSRDLTHALIELPYAAARWEVAVLGPSRYQRRFECVIVPRPRLRKPAAPDAFAPYFTPAQTAAFPSLGKDALLVVPCPVPGRHAAGPTTKNIDYAHLLAFLRTAPERQIVALWQHVAREALRLVRDQPVWVNTAGAGVPWLHIRLDRCPKYYSYSPYRTMQP
ncbi:MAG: hypothetical protein KatS3mg111_0995 [Pirellulaceae bacterium]|nr:MAG: hypothetical protein KatS3mg111_0995 [Pirellulaceae bacterium]